MRLYFDAETLAIVPQGHDAAVEKSTAGVAAPPKDAHDSHAFNPLEPSFGLTFWGVIVYVTLIGLLAKFAWGPITKMVEDREKRIRADLDGAERARIEADRRMAEYQRRLDEAAAEAKAKVEDAVAKAEKQGAEIMALRRSEADQLLEKAKKQIEAERDKALAEVRQTAVELAMEITRTVVKRTASQDDLAKTADEVLPKFKSAV
jgi:F-type H+-transporting ATPase subunit b